MNSSQDPQSQKQSLRAELRRRINAIDSTSFNRASAQASKILLERPEWRNAEYILAYSPLRGELDLSAFLETASALGKLIALPRYSPESKTYCAALASGTLAAGHFGIAEPAADAPVVPMNRLDFLLVPGVGFDPDGRRLGRGKGFYDRLLAGAAGVKCGVALDEQLVPALPAEAHDITMNFILTPTRWVLASPTDP